MLVKVLASPKVGIVGLGREGNSTIAWLRNRGYAGEIFVADLSPKEIPSGVNTAFWGQDYLRKISEIPIIFRSPGVPVSKLIDAGCSSAGITSQTSIVLQNCNVVGVTGTKGKSTVTSLIFHILKLAKGQCHLAGNLGIPFFELPQRAWSEQIIAELSSHQLSDVSESPNIAVLLPIVPEHLDYYSNFEEYYRAKENIYKFQSEDNFLVATPDCEHGIRAINSSNAKVITYGESEGSLFSVSGATVSYNGTPIVENTMLRGTHNTLNIAAAIACCLAAGVAISESVRHLSTFEPLMYRLETVRIVRGIEFVDDPLATTPEALIAGINTFSGRIGAILCGGHERNQNYASAAKSIVDNGVKMVLAFPTTGARIALEVSKYANECGIAQPNVVFVNSMDDAVKAVFETCSEGDICLHSPGAPSFGVFLNYKDRSKAYREAIQSYVTLK